MNMLPSLPAPESLSGPRFTLDRRVCVAANRWGARHLVGPFFVVISRLGDGVFWYLLMGLLGVFGGQHG